MNAIEVIAIACIEHNFMQFSRIYIYNFVPLLYHHIQCFFRQHFFFQHFFSVVTHPVLITWRIFQTHVHTNTHTHTHIFIKNIHLFWYGCEIWMQISASTHGTTIYYVFIIHRKGVQTYKFIRKTIVQKVFLPLLSGVLFLCALLFICQIHFLDELIWLTWINNSPSVERTVKKHIFPIRHNNNNLHKSSCLEKWGLIFFVLPFFIIILCFFFLSLIFYPRCSSSFIHSREFFSFRLSTFICLYIDFLLMAMRS